jgi:hypothetical protein
MSSHVKTEYEYLVYSLGKLGRSYHEASRCFRIVSLFETLLFNERADVHPTSVTSAVPPDPSSPAMFPDNERMLECLDGLSVDVIGTYPVQMADPLWRIFVRIILYFKDTQDILILPSNCTNKLPIRLGQAIAVARVQWKCDEYRRDEVDLFLQRAQAAHQKYADIEDQQLDMSPFRSRERYNQEQKAGSQPGPATPYTEDPIDQAELRPSDADNTTARSRFNDGVSALVRKHGPRPPPVPPHPSGTSGGNVSSGGGGGGEPGGDDNDKRDGEGWRKSRGGHPTSQERGNGDVNVTESLSPFIMSAVGKQYCHASSCFTGDLAVAPSFADWASTFDRFMQRLGVLNDQHRVCLMEQPLTSDARAFYGTDVAKEEYMKLIPTFRVNAGLRHNVPATSAIVYSIGDSVYTYSEMPGVRTGTHRIVGFDGKAILADVATMLMSLKVSHLKSSLIPLRIMWTGVLTPSDPRVGSPEMTIAMKDELDQLFARGPFKIVILRDPRHKNIHPTEFIWTIKHENGREFYKARFVVRGHRDRWKYQLVLTATSLWQTSVRLLLATASIFDWPIWTTDVPRA